jgi:hypothetical protein
MVHAWNISHPLLREGREAISRAGEFFKSRID